MIVIFVVLGVLFAEIVGYFLHRLLHSERIAWLSKGHMIHHLQLYGPQMSQRSEVYKNPPHAPRHLSIGSEWLVPVLVLLAGGVTALTLIGVSTVDQVAFFGATVGWTLLLFNYMHDAMHLQNFWMLRWSWTNRWFRRTRRLHDIHHVRVTDDGLMDANFGICFHWLDRIFGTYVFAGAPLNEKGLRAAHKRYASLLD